MDPDGLHRSTVGQQWYDACVDMTTMIDGEASWWSGGLLSACAASLPAAAAPKAAPVAVPTVAPVFRSGGGWTSSVLVLCCLCCWLADSDMLSVCWRW
jgi:hypothetical protein